MHLATTTSTFAQRHSGTSFSRSAWSCPRNHKPTFRGERIIHGGGVILTSAVYSIQPHHLLQQAEDCKAASTATRDTTKLFFRRSSSPVRHVPEVALLHPGYLLRDLPLTVCVVFSTRSPGTEHRPRTGARTRFPPNATHQRVSITTR